MEKIKQISINLTPNRWIKTILAENKYFYLYKFMAESYFFSELENIKEMKLPYIYIESNDEQQIEYIEISTGLVRVVPVFYKVEQGTLFISDDINTLINEKSLVNYNSLKEFLVFSYVLEDRTLLDEIKQVQAGEVLKGKINSNLHKEDYFIYDEGEEFKLGKEELIDCFEDVLYKTFELYTQKLKNKIIIVPLSGGYDSRLIVTMLKEFGFKDVLCVSYGVEGNFETRKASTVAEKMKYDLNIVVYRPEESISLYKNKYYFNYIEYAAQKSSLAVSQEFITMEYLKQKYNFSKDEVVFMPGHTGDFVSGSHIPYRLLKNASFDALKLSIFERHSLREGGKQNILDNYPFKFKEQYKNIEYFDWRERQSKFIVNANRNYDFNGYSWVLPYWFNDYVLFWCKVPLVYKYQKNLYDEYLEENIFKKYDLDFDKQERINIRKKNNNYSYIKLKEIVHKSYMVKKIYKKFKKNYNPLFGYTNIGEDILQITKEKFPFGNQKLNSIIDKEFGLNRNRVNINAYLTEFYLSKILEEHKVDEL